jgi:hypothetical protein
MDALPSITFHRKKVSWKVRARVTATGREQDLASIKCHLKESTVPRSPSVAKEAMEPSGDSAPSPRK